ncbi:MAG: NAD-dependent protein deacylase [Gammaproteobacteria bacterium HGW-Gammaproteobacteria-14]|nr:MAG: NAD-dependent protein deacylase [Gammaproteobacteria bacterium HGW-Gammaproteobacteria-14]
MNIVILTGAGISAESGIRTFRGADGLWENHRLEDVATPEAFARNPALVQRFYNERRRQLQLPEIQPNAAHLALARLEQELPGSVTLITQNIDDLHGRAGSRNMVHMHGELLSVFCTRSKKRRRWNEDLATAEPCDCCQPPGILRPDVVWFGEIPLQMERIEEALMNCQLFISIGTSGNVYPAAGFVRLARQAGARCIEVNIEGSMISDAFHEHRVGPASVKVPQLVDELLGR